ncbi:choice-of-anchor J domain-containing protein [Flavobacterium sp.]|uniref:choice-of-anchor J domain-containing protein n=1 Tax=Flavobacterium sp. TaxID=239 RepID=UPI00404707EB
MKKIFNFLFTTTILLSLMTSCISDDDYVIPPVRIPFFQEDFETATNNTNLDLTDWTNFAEEGTWLWREKTFGGNGYAEFSAFGSGSASNLVWLVSPSIDLNGYSSPVLKFSVAQHHLDVDSPDNSLEVLISTDYDGTNVLAATWTAVNANIPNSTISWYQFVKSTVALPSTNGNIHIAFKFKGSGTNTALDGAFQVDNILLYNEN